MRVVTRLLCDIEPGLASSVAQQHTKVGSSALTLYAHRSLDYICRNTGAIPIDIVGKVAESVLQGLVYLYDVHRIIHRGRYPPLRLITQWKPG